ncbi:MAG: signal peptide peptidase SppA [Eikenella sp.]|nr:signal peptide peptidase SppA [Eikenella sp.]
MKYTVPHPEKRPENWERDTLEKVLLEAYREQRRARIWKLVFRLILLAFFALYLVAVFGKMNRFNPHSQQPHTAVIQLDGVITSQADQVAKLRDGLTAAYKNPHVKGVIIRANSPGGSPVVSNIAYQEIRRLKAEHPNIPLYLVTEDVCASGCYYIAAAADKIYADPTSIVGSIGVVGSSFDLTGLMDHLGVKRRNRTAGEHKGMGDPFSPETPEQAAMWQAMLDDIHRQFIHAVREGRGKRLKETEYPDLFSGRIYTGSEAVKTGLIDATGNIYSVSRDIIKAPELVDYTPQDSLSRTLSKNFGASIRQSMQEISRESVW